MLLIVVSCASLALICGVTVFVLVWAKRLFESALRAMSEQSKVAFEILKAQNLGEVSAIRAQEAQQATYSEIMRQEAMRSSVSREDPVPISPFEAREIPIERLF